MPRLTNKALRASSAVRCGWTRHAPRLEHRACRRCEHPVVAHQLPRAPLSILGKGRQDRGLLGLDRERHEPGSRLLPGWSEDGSGASLSMGVDARHGAGRRPPPRVRESESRPLIEGYIRGLSVATWRASRGTPAQARSAAPDPRQRRAVAPGRALRAGQAPRIPPLGTTEWRVPAPPL